MSNDPHEAYDTSIYYKIFGALLFLTVITVLLNKLHVGIVLAVTLALLVAFTKASLVASFFMHLIAEKKAIYWILGFTGIFVAGMLVLIIGSIYSIPEGTMYLEHKTRPVSEKPGGHHAIKEAHH